MRLRQLTGLEQDKLRAEYDELMALIADLKEILASEDRRMQIIKDELNYVKENTVMSRKSIEYAASEMRIEDLIADEEVVIRFHTQDISNVQVWTNTKYKTEEECWFKRFNHKR
jgi:DNA gyrase subunit A